MRNPLESGKKIEEPLFSKDLKGPLTDTEMQKVVDFYLKINESPGPDKFQTELIKTMSPEQIRVLQKWLNEILAKGALVTKVTEVEMTGRLTLLHKGGSKSDQISHWIPVVLLNITNHLIAYAINERITEMVEHMDILTPAQGGFRQNKSTDINT
jgi:hypothetical protein